MSNTLTGLIPIIYRAADVVARERIGMIPAVTLDAQAAQAALGQTVRSFVTAPTTLAAIVPGVTPPNTGGQTLNYKDIVINNSYEAPVQWTGDEQKSVGTQYERILQNQFEQAFRTLSNNVEASLVTTGVNGASRATGTAGVTPFANAASTVDAANASMILSDNGVPDSDRQLVVNTLTFRNLASSPYLFKVNESGNDDLLRQGVIGYLEGFDLHKSAQMKNKHYSGLSTTAAAYTTVGANVNGDYSITTNTSVSAANTGDVVAFTGDTVDQYVVNAGSGTTLTLAQPGLQNTASNTTFTSVGNYLPNLAFHRSAILLAARVPAMPAGGDAASDVITIEDPVSGLTFQVAMYKEYRQVHIEIGLAWGSLAVKSEFITILLG